MKNPFLKFQSQTFIPKSPRTLRLPRLPFFTKWGNKPSPSPKNSPPPPHLKSLSPHRRNPVQPPLPLPLPPQQLPIRPSPREGPLIAALETTPITTPIHSSRYLGRWLGDSLLILLQLVALLFFYSIIIGRVVILKHCQGLPWI